MPPAKGAVKPPPRPQKGLALTTLEEVMAFADLAYKAGPPPGFGRPEAVALAVIYGQEVGLLPAQSVASIKVLNGRPSIYGEAAIALVRSSGLCERIDFGVRGTDNDRYGYAVSERAGESVPRETRFTVADAKLAGLWGGARAAKNGKPPSGPWVEYPERMLQWRALGFHFKDWWPDVLCGLILFEEAQDYDDVIVVEAQPEPLALPAPKAPVKREPFRAVTVQPPEKPAIPLNPAGPISEAQLQQIKENKKRWLDKVGATDPKAAWAELLGQWGVESATQMTAAQADSLLETMLGTIQEGDELQGTF